MSIIGRGKGNTEYPVINIIGFIEVFILNLLSQLIYQVLTAGLYKKHLKNAMC